MIYFIPKPKSINEAIPIAPLQSMEITLNVLVFFALNASIALKTRGIKARMHVIKNICIIVIVSTRCLVFLIKAQRAAYCF